MNRLACILALSVGVFTVSQPLLGAEPSKQAKGKPAPIQSAKSTKAPSAPATSVSAEAASAAEIAQWKNKPFVERFKHADANGDGKLSQAEAGRGHTPDVAKNFAAMDTTKDGMISLQERSAFNVRKAEQSAAAASKDEPAHKAKGKPAGSKKS